MFGRFGGSQIIVAIVRRKCSIRCHKEQQCPDLALQFGLPPTFDPFLYVIGWVAFPVLLLSIDDRGLIHQRERGSIPSLVWIYSASELFCQSG